MAKKIILNEKSDAFYDLVTKLSNEVVTLCEQCGTCSSGCPFIDEMDIMPSEMMRKSMLGQEDVLESKTIWVCATCNTCTVRCPRNLDVSKVAEALRQILLRKEVENLDINNIPSEKVKELPQIALIAAMRKFTS
ncbi:MAG: 4Fe-4S dicluster domain-containing protein [Candidatus Cloacimonadota bacterium]|nr:4Fe-4S dicluster domain-containing protein [Candidatus Cloacimonadota bacterium]